MAGVRPKLDLLVTITDAAELGYKEAGGQAITGNVGGQVLSSRVDSY